MSVKYTLPADAPQEKLDEVNSKLTTVESGLADKAEVIRKTGTVGTINVDAQSYYVINFSLPTQTGYTQGPISFSANHDACFVSYNTEGKVNVFNAHTAQQSVKVTYVMILFKKG